MHKTWNNDIISEAEKKWLEKHMKTFTSPFIPCNEIIDLDLKLHKRHSANGKYESNSFGIMLGIRNNRWFQNISVIESYLILGYSQGNAHIFGRLWLV